MGVSQKGNALVVFFIYRLETTLPVLTTLMVGQDVLAQHRKMRGQYITRVTQQSLAPYQKPHTGDGADVLIPSYKHHGPVHVGLL